MSTSKTPRSGVGGQPVAAPGPRVHRRRGGDGIPALAFLTPSIVTFLVFVLAPTVGVLVLSFYDWNLLSDGTFVGLDNFDRLVHDDRLLGVYGSTTYMALAILAVNVVAGLLLAVLLESRMPAWLRGFFRLSFLFPFVVSASAVALIWRFLLNKDLGLVNYLLGLLHVDRIDWLGSSAFAPVSVIIVSSWKTIGFSILVYIAGLQSIPPQLKEAAIVDGANAWTRFWRITFPLLSPTIFFLVVINTINSFQIFAEPRVLTQGGPGDASRTIVEYLYDRAFGDFDLGYASAIGITFTLVLIVLTAIQFRLSRRWTYYE
ncbi:carbohydrate ABC transporter permease [Dactylosporangium siamense]|uniref:ABC transporter permease n=1 Tax=Dactylosporangium siamense TaxID=685454 RepID=A0A919PJU3_9ACTN|nr:sugar ABC transporter permease [Dactylosporangium siamense]GIG45269.1 ABC transporter permease [Dactylosporangium siamense]